jgi:hypothetical protein
MLSVETGEALARMETGPLCPLSERKRENGALLQDRQGDAQPAEPWRLLTARTSASSSHVGCKPAAIVRSSVLFRGSGLSPRDPRIYGCAGAHRSIAPDAIALERRCPTSGAS